MNDKLEIEGDKRDDVSAVDKLEKELQLQFFFMDTLNEVCTDVVNNTETETDNGIDSKDFF